MSLYNLDFSGWRRGNEAYAQGLLNSETQLAKAKAARTRGLESGLGTIAGAVIGGMIGGPAGIFKGASIGGSILSGDQIPKDQLLSLAGGLVDKIPMATPYGDAVDPAQVASASNMVGGLKDMSAAATGSMYGQWDPTVFTK